MGLSEPWHVTGAVLRACPEEFDAGIRDHPAVRGVTDRPVDWREGREMDLSDVLLHDHFAPRGGPGTSTSVLRRQDSGKNTDGDDDE